MKRILPLLLLVISFSCNNSTKAYQIIVTPDKEYYVAFYSVDCSNCITFISYNGDDSSKVKLCEPWDVKPNPDYSDKIRSR